MPNKKLIEEKVFSSLRQIETLMSQRERSNELPPATKKVPEDIFQFKPTPTVLPVIDDWKIWADKFINSKTTDVLGHAPHNNALWVGKNTGAGGFDFAGSESQLPQTRDTTGRPRDDVWTILVGKFTGKEVNDVVGYALSRNALYVGDNDGSGKFYFDDKLRTFLPLKDEWRFWTG